MFRAIFIVRCWCAKFCVAIPIGEIFALGGPHLRDAGAKIIGDTSGLGVIGFISALQVLPRALHLKRQVLAWLDTHQIDGAILCDWGGFNARLLPDLKAREVPTLFYFPPRSWQKTALAPNEKNIVAELSTVIATPFEWSAQALNAAGGNAHWVGHPLLEKQTPSKAIRTIRIEFGAVGPHDKLIALLPGSRELELKMIAPQINAAVRQMKRDFLKPAGDDETWHFVAAVPNGARETACKYLQEPTAVVENRAGDVLAACDAAIVKSGTSTLEAAVAGAPQVVVYDLPPLLRAQWEMDVAAKSAVCGDAQHFAGARIGAGIVGRRLPRRQNRARNDGVVGR